MKSSRTCHAVRALLLSFCFVSAAPSAQEGQQKRGDRVDATARILFLPGQIEWKEGPVSLPPGAKIAVLEGDPAEEGFFTMRLLLPDGYRVAPHWHPRQERITIISGTLMLGMGDRFEARAMGALGPGTYSSMPAGMTHFALARGETVIQLSSIGPWAVIYVDPADDPRNGN